QREAVSLQGIDGHSNAQRRHERGRVRAEREDVGIALDHALVRLHAHEAPVPWEEPRDLDAETVADGAGPRGHDAFQLVAELVAVARILARRVDGPGDPRLAAVRMETPERGLDLEAAPRVQRFLLRA